MLLPASSLFRPPIAGVSFDAAHPALVSVTPPDLGTTAAKEARNLGVGGVELGEGKSAAPPTAVLVSDANAPTRPITSPAAAVVETSAAGEARMDTSVRELGEGIPAIPPNAELDSNANSPGSTSPAADVAGMTATGDASMCEDGDMATNLLVGDALDDALDESKPNLLTFAVSAPVEPTPSKNVSIRSPTEV